MEKVPNRGFKPKYNEQMLGRNPFLDNLVIEVSGFELKKQYKQDYDGNYINVVVEAEYEKKTSIYVAAEKRLRVSKLMKPAKELYLWLLYEADNGKDFLWINKVRYMQENSINSPTTFRTAIKQLITDGFIVKSSVDTVYWINPSLFFNGNRIVRFPKNVEHR